MRQGVLQLESAAADVFQVRTQEAKNGVVRDAKPRLFDLLLVDQDTAGKNESLCTFPRGSVTLIDQELIEPLLHGSSVSSKMVQGLSLLRYIALRPTLEWLHARLQIFFREQVQFER